MSLAYFSKTNGGSEELWVTDGTIAGTHLVKAFGGGTELSGLVTIGGRAYFGAPDGTHGFELWTSDGTLAGTALVKDINTGIGDSFPNALTNVNGTLFFGADDGTHNDELWKSDGTQVGTVLVKDINPGPNQSLPSALTNLNGTLFFEADDGTHGAELWKSDGTQVGTVLVRDINPGGNSNPTFLINVNGTLFFSASDGASSGQELWKSDGTAVGTVLVKDINSGAGDSFPNFLTNLNGTLLFEANDGAAHGGELWKSDGTAGGTVLVKDIRPGPGSSSPSGGFATVNGAVLFRANDGTAGNELWKSDGTQAGTVLVRDINSGSNPSDPNNLTSVNGTVFFDASDGIHGDELWKSDGTPAGTVLVSDIDPGPLGSGPFGLTNVNGIVEFYASPDGVHTNLYRSDGTATGTFALATDVDTNTPISFSPVHPNDFNGDGNADTLWRSSNGSLANWLMNGNVITSGNFVTSNGAVVAPDASFSVAGLSDFNGDGNADVLWRSTSGVLADWTMNGQVITSSAELKFNGATVRPDASFNITGTGDFDGDSKSDILWRSTSGELDDWSMNGNVISSSAQLTFNGAAVRPDASFSIAGIGDFDGDGKRDILWRSTSGELDDWSMNGPVISSSAQLTFNGATARPDASFSIAGVGDFNGDGKSDILWRSTSGAVIDWLMNGSVITTSAFVTSNGGAVSVGAAWHVVETGDFDGNGSTDILWRNDNGALAEWLMNGTTIVASVTPSFNGAAVQPDASFSTQAKPTDFA